jgi:uncharacterized protein YndB with AHSA1/START domain
MAAFTDEMQINSPSTTVFDLMADARNELQWNGGVSRVELRTDEPVGKGSQFVVEDRRGEHEVAITLFDRPGRIEFALTGTGMDVAIKYSFTETDGTTTAVGNFDAQPKGFMKVLLPSMMPMIKRDIAKQHVHFKKFCETEAG